MTDIHEIHGVNKVTEVASSSTRDGTSVIVADREDCIVLNIGGATYSAGLTAGEARFIAAQLIAAADRLGARSVEGTAQ